MNAGPSLGSAARHRLASRRAGVAVCVLAICVSTVCAVGRAHADDASSAPTATSVPVLAYYYIWFDATTWNRAKSDLPLTGKYSSDERSVMLEHILTAQAAGIDGFIVSWKRTEKLDRRLETLIELCASNDFKLAIIYQGLDFEREPLPVSRIVSDLDHFIETFTPNPVFDLFEKPAVILSGSWRFGRDEVEAIGLGRRDQLMLLGSEKDVEGIERLDGLIDGDAYYWSSVNPVEQGKYQERLDAMSEVVHRAGGIWIPPAAPGFDARLVGGTSVVERNDGETLALELEAALAASPDAIGLISWNEFSENSHVEPSRRYGTRYVEKVAELLGGTGPVEPIPAGDPFDSSEPGDRGSGTPQVAALGLVVVIMVAATWVASKRRRRQFAGEGQ